MTDGPDETLARGDPGAFALAVGALVGRPDTSVDELAARLDGWAAGDDEALAIAAVTAYGEVAAVRPEWIDDETRKLRRALEHPNPAVRRAAGAALARIGNTRMGSMD